jgi:hypothetical protein
MTAAEFKKKWSRYEGKETSAYQSHFDDLCRLLGQPAPNEADPSGANVFCYQKRVVKDAELFETDGAEAGPSERGFADVWKKGCFGWEYKRKKKNLDAAYQQLLRYREALENPPLLVVCDFDRYIIRTNFNGTVQEVYDFTNDQIDRPENLRVLRAVFENPDFLRPQRTTEQVTEILARQIADVARSLQDRESRELADARTKAELNFAQRRNLRIARFLNRLVFCFFAEDTALLPEKLFSEVLKTGLEDLRHLAETLETLFKVMATGGTFGKDKIRQFNGHLFEDATVFELTGDELKKLAAAGQADWQFIQPSIMGTLFERAMDESQRAQLGAHYTGEADIRTLVEPVLLAPLRREWAALAGELAAVRLKGRGNAAQRAKLVEFQNKLSSVTVLDPACGSGNFLYVSLQLLLSLEKEVIALAGQLGFTFKPRVNVQQLRAIEINPYAFELAQVSVQIGYLQWRRDNGFDNDRTPILQNLDGFQNEDALLAPHFRSKPRTLREARAGEHTAEDALKFYTEREWPNADIIVGNPPFLGDKVMRRELGDSYVDELRRIYGHRIPGQSDLCCYWFEKARHQIENGKCKRAGLLATQGIRNGANREVLKRIKETGDIFFAVSDRKWVLNGANVNISIIGFDRGLEKERMLDGKSVAAIHANLRGSETGRFDLTAARRLAGNGALCFVGVMKGGPFDLPDEQGIQFLASPNPHGKPNSDVLRPRLTARDILRRGLPGWIIDFGVDSQPEDCAKYEEPWEFAVEIIKPVRDSNRRRRMAEKWWMHGEARPGMRQRLEGLRRVLVTPEVSKHRVFVWLPTVYLPDHKLRAIASDSDYWFGVLHSRFHEIWALKLGSRLQTRPCYTPTTCFETFPFPYPNDLAPRQPAPKQQEPADETGWERTIETRFLTIREEPPAYPFGGGPRQLAPAQHRAAIATAAKELNELRESWLNPPEWTVERTLVFPGSAGGPWKRYLDAKTVDPKTGIGTVRFPRLEPRDPACAAKLKMRTLTRLYNERPAWLAFAHKQLDASVAAAYGWPDNLSDGQILEKMLALNLERADGEQSGSKEKPRFSRERLEHELI